MHACIFIFQFQIICKREREKAMLCSRVIYNIYEAGIYNIYIYMERCHTRSRTYDILRKTVRVISDL